MNVKIDILTIHTLYDMYFFKVFTKYFSKLTEEVINKYKKEKNFVVKLRLTSTKTKWMNYLI